jgi:hypothetical protein
MTVSVWRYTNSVGYPDSYVFELSGFISTRVGFGSGSFYHLAKILRKTLIPTDLWLLYDFLSSTKCCKCRVALKTNKHKKFSYHPWRSLTKIAESGVGSESDPLVRGEEPDPDPYQNVMDPQHCTQIIKSCLFWRIRYLGHPRRRPRMPGGTRGPASSQEVKNRALNCCFHCCSFKQNFSPRTFLAVM